MQKGKFRSIRLRVKHALAAKRAARIDTVKTADQLAFRVPNLDAVSEPVGVHFGICADEFVGYPRSRFARPHRVRTAFDHSLESGVDRYRVFRFSSRLFEAFRNVKLRKFEYRPAFGA